MQLWQQCEEKKKDKSQSKVFLFYSLYKRIVKRITREHQRKSKPNVQKGVLVKSCPTPTHYSQRQSFQCRQDRAAPGHPCIRCCLWLLPLSSQLCCWQWKIICVLLRLNVLHTVSAQKTHGWHFALCISNIQSDRAGKHLVLKTSCDTDRETLDTRARERVFSPQAYFKSKSNQK